MNRESLQYRIFTYSLTLAITILVIVITASYFVMAHSVQHEIGERALNIAETTAQHPAVISGLKKDVSTTELQQFALDIQDEVEAQYVVIGDENGIRYAHPVAERIGQQMVGDDNDRALIEGKSYVSKATGTLGSAIRGKSAVIDENGEIIGVVSVGFLQENILSVNLSYAKYLVLVFLIVLILSIVLSRYLANRIKEDLLDFEPAEIVQLLTERNALVESIREAVIMVDVNGRVVLSNQAADRIFPEQNSIVGQPIYQVIPHTRLMEIIQTGKEELDKVMTINGHEALVNRIPIVKEGKVTGAIASFRRMDEIDIVAQELAQTKSYSESLRAQTHEHQNFLYMISGLIQLKEYEEALDLIHRQQMDTASLISFVTQHIEDPYVSAMIIGFYNRARERHVTLELDQESSCGVLPLDMEKHLLVSILGNLVTNAFEAVEDLQESDRRVRFYIVEHPDEFVIEVEDAGPGIAEHLLPLLFTKGQSTKDPMHRGFGMRIIKDHLDQLGGTISLETGDYGGALFVLSIPKEVTQDATHD